MKGLLFSSKGLRSPVSREEAFGESGERLTEKWCDCHLNNGMVCSRFYESGSGGFCSACGHERSCHEHERFIPGPILGTEVQA